MNTITLTLSEPPSANRYWRTVNGRPILSKLARLYKAAAGLSALGQGVSQPVPRATACGVTIHWFRARKSGDLDNRIKIVLDAIQGVAYEDDAQITELHAFRHDDKHNPRVVILITPSTP